jgi:integrase
VLDPSEARALLDSIDVSTHVGLRDRALIGLMVYSFARIGAALGMTVEDVLTQNRRLWVRLREKGGKRHAIPCHHNLEEYLTAYLDGTGLRGDPKGPLFRTIGRGTGKLTRTVLPQANAYAMIRRRAAAAGIDTKLGNHSFRAGFRPRPRRARKGASQMPLSRLHGVVCPARDTGVALVMTRIDTAAMNLFLV